MTYACELGTVMSELQLETACSGELNALIRRAVLRRLTDAWATAEGRVGEAGTHTNALVKEMVDKTGRFRQRCLPEELDGRMSGAMGTLLRWLAADLAEAVHQDENVAGLLDRAFGDWLVLPTIYDMLEYRIPDELGPTAIEAFRRLSQRCKLPENLGWLEAAFSRSARLTMREWLESNALQGSTGE